MPAVGYSPPPGTASVLAWWPPQAVAGESPGCWILMSLRDFFEQDPEDGAIASFEAGMDIADDAAAGWTESVLGCPVRLVRTTTKVGVYRTPGARPLFAGQNPATRIVNRLTERKPVPGLLYWVIPETAAEAEAHQRDQAGHAEDPRAAVAGVTCDRHEAVAVGGW